MYRSTCAWSYADWLHTLDVAGPIFSEDERDRAARSARTFLLVYQRLAQESVARGTFIYKIRPKLHDWEHTIMLLEAGSLFNPRFMSCFSEEDLMGRIKKLGLKCPRQSAPWRILEKWLLQAFRRWSGRMRDWVADGRLS